MIIGVTPGITKPEMKRQMRSLINQINGVEDKYPNYSYTYVAIYNMQTNI
jgi:hypothetical protein